MGDNFNFNTVLLLIIIAGLAFSAYWMYPLYVDYINFINNAETVMQSIEEIRAIIEEWRNSPQREAVLAQLRQQQQAYQQKLMANAGI